MNTRQAISACAEGEAAWHAVAYRGLGHDWINDGHLARAGSSVPHPLLLGAVTLDPGASVPDDVPGVICDSFAELRLRGREPEPTGHWMVHEGPPVAPRPLPGLTIRRVTTDEDVTWFETLAFLAADGAPPERPGELHPPGSQRLPGLTLVVAELDGAGVGTSLSVATPRVNNIGAVTVMPAYRGRGIGAALTLAAMACAPGLPSVLSATELGRPVYRRLGFEEVGRPVHWTPVG